MTETPTAFMIPRCEGRAFELRSGQIFRVIAVEGKQVGDLTLVSRHDRRETFSSHLTAGLSGGSLRRAAELYSRPPFARVMLTVVEDPVGVHWIHGRCTRMWYQRRLGVADHPNCHDNLVTALRPYGLTEYDLPLDTFNIFMAGHLDAENRYSFSPPVAGPGDFITFRAEMDLLVAISACPDVSEINDHAPKPLRVEIGV
jgi:uncharacterized protein YcgI (DUF1989 family)